MTVEVNQVQWTVEVNEDAGAAGENYTVEIHYQGMQMAMLQALIFRVDQLSDTFNDQVADFNALVAPLQVEIDAVEVDVAAQAISISAETAARIAGDNALAASILLVAPPLQAEIDAEEIARAAADAIEITNRNAAISAATGPIISDVVALDATVATFSGSISTLQSNVTTLQGNVTTWVADLAAIDADVVALAADIANANDAVADELAARVLSEAAIVATIPTAGSSVSPPMTAPLLAAYAWVNQGTASVADKATRMVMTVPYTAGTNVRLLKKALPATPNTVTCAIGSAHMGFASGAVIVGLYVRNSTTGTFTGVEMLCGSGVNEIRVARWASATSYTSAVYESTSYITSGLIWLRITDDGTDRKFYISGTGKDWSLFFTEARTTHTTPDEFGIGVYNTMTTFDMKVPVFHVDAAFSVLGDAA